MYKNAKNGDFLTKYGQNQSQFLSWAHRATSVPGSVISKEILFVCLFSFLSYCAMTVDIGTVLPSHGVFNKNYWPVLAFFSKNWPEIGNRCLEILFLCLRNGLALRSLVSGTRSVTNQERTDSIILRKSWCGKQAAASGATYDIVGGSHFDAFEIWDFLALVTKNHQTVPDEANCPLTWRRKNLYRLIHTFLKASFWTKLFRLSSWPWCLAAAVDYYIFRDRSIIPCYCNDNVNFLI